MIRRPNVKARCFQHNYRTCTPLNRHYKPRHYRLYLYGRWCRWCRREYYFTYYAAYPRLCHTCAKYLIDLETDHTIAIMPNGYRTDADRKILKLERPS